MDAEEIVPIIDSAARAIHDARALLIGAGAGMGVDSGLPDFRGDQGFWKAYPPFRGRRFAEMSNPKWFRKDPAQAWGFFGHRLHLYRDAQPHAGFEILRRWCNERSRTSFVFTSNVDGHFQRAGFNHDAVVECHGSIEYLQCSQVCSTEIWSAEQTQVTVNDASIRAEGDLPECHNCGAVSRPNILMFGDYEWVPRRTGAQEQRYKQWLYSLSDEPLVAIELGAGTAVPTVRWECESRADVLIRINPRDFEVHDATSQIAIPLTALDALTRIDERLEVLRRDD